MDTRDDRARTELRPEIALGWRRSALSGLDPGMDVKEPRLFDVDRHSRLLRAADPVLSNMVVELDDTRFSVLLADHRARIVDRRMGHPQLHLLLDKVKAVPGAEYVEEYCGTNSLSTAFELRKPIAIAGGEHFLEALQVFCCYGAPIVHPITRRLEGVLDITGPVEDFSPLLGPFLMRAVHDIEQRLQEGARLSEQRVFAAFQAESARTKNPVMMLTENLALSNAAALELFSSTDHVALRALVNDSTLSSSVMSRTVMLTSGHEVDLTLRLATSSGDGVVVEAIPRPEPVRVPPRPRVGARTDRVVLIIGEPGSGRTTRAQELTGVGAASFDFALEADNSWQARLRTALTTEDAVIVENVHLIRENDAAFARSVFDRSTAFIVMTATSMDDKSPEHSALAALADSRIVLPALRESPHLIGEVVTAVLRQVAEMNGSPEDSAVPQLRVAPPAMDLLMDQPWPGNISELRRVVTNAARGRSRGDITAQDLPPTHRTRSVRRLSTLERAERDAIAEALKANRGNKAAAAVSLGIGRTTLYQRIRYYHLSS